MVHFAHAVCPFVPDDETFGAHKDRALIAVKVGDQSALALVTIPRGLPVDALTTAIRASTNGPLASGASSLGNFRFSTELPHSSH